MAFSFPCTLAYTKDLLITRNQLYIVNGIDTPADDQRRKAKLSPLETPTVLCPPQADGKFR